MGSVEVIEGFEPPACCTLLGFWATRASLSWMEDQVSPKTAGLVGKHVFIKDELIYAFKVQLSMKVSPTAVPAQWLRVVRLTISAAMLLYAPIPR